MVDTSKHVGFPLPPEMFHEQPKKRKEDFVKHEAICNLLDIPLKCPYCNEVLKEANETR